MKRLGALLRIRWFTLVALAAGCGAPGDELAAQSRPIIGGIRDELHGAVVAFENTDYGTLCSGTLITPRVILTAAHCVLGATVESLEVTFGSDADFPIKATVSELGAHPDYNMIAFSNDLALLRLTERAPGYITPIPYLPAAQANGLLVGTPLVQVGFGEDDEGNAGVRLQVTNTLSLVCLAPEGCPYQGGKITVPQNDLCYLQTHGGTCSGDSGGPLLVYQQGEWVAGVTSFGDQLCASYGCGSKVDAFEGFIREFTYPLGGLGGLCRGTADPDFATLGACDDGAVCQENACCERVCTGADESCSRPGLEGYCTTPQEGCACDAAGNPASGAIGITLLLLPWVCYRRRPA